jgi:hypothetical protein
LEKVTVVVSLDIHQDVVPVKKPRIEVYWFLFRLRLHKFSRPEYRRERFLRWWWPIIIRTWWRWHWIWWHIWRTMMLMHLDIICAVQQISFGHGWEAETHPGGGAEMHPGAATANL